MEQFIACSEPADVARMLEPQCMGRLLVTGRTLHEELAPYVALVCFQTWNGLVADVAVQAHYAEILDASDPATLLERRAWLQQVDAETLSAQWRQVAVNRLVQRSSLDGVDLFSALKRAYLASQVPSLMQLPAVVCWMHLLGAIEEQDQAEAKRLMAEALEPLARGTTERNLIWRLQAAHFVDALPALAGCLVGAGVDAGELHAWLETTAAKLADNPSLGRYGPAGDPYHVRSKHLRAILLKSFR